jgi:hypothetical protein
MPDFAFKIARDASANPASTIWLGAFQPHCGDAGEPACVDTWTGWDWVDNTPNAANIDCGSLGCGKSCL